MVDARPRCHSRNVRSASRIRRKLLSVKSPSSVRSSGSNRVSSSTRPSSPAAPARESRGQRGARGQAGVEPDMERGAAARTCAIRRSDSRRPCQLLRPPLGSLSRPLHLLALLLRWRRVTLVVEPHAPHGVPVGISARGAPGLRRGGTRRPRLHRRPRGSAPQEQSERRHRSQHAFPTLDGGTGSSFGWSSASGCTFAVNRMSPILRPSEWSRCLSRPSGDLERCMRSVELVKPHLCVLGRLRRAKPSSSTGPLKALRYDS